MFKLCFLADADSVHTRKWVDYFSAFNYELHLISLRNTNYIYSDNVHIHVIKPKYKSKLSYFLLVNKVRRLVKSLNPDILHSHYATSYGLLGASCNFHPFIISAWGSDINEFPNHSKLHSKLLKFILSKSDLVCATSQSLEENVKKYYDKNTIVTPFGVDLNLFNNKIPVLSNKKITIGTLKGLEKIYGIDILLHSFTKLANNLKNEDLRLLIVGDGSEKDSLINLCKELDISERVEFTGHIDNHEVANYINKMDIVCIPSLSEGFGVCAVEACACGRPVIASNTGGLSEIIQHGYNGYLVEPSNVEDLEKMLRLLITQKDKLVAFSKNACNTAVVKYDWNKNANEMLKAYNLFVELDTLPYITKKSS
jgi:glycosyltransferase involved in cell wall biosynthesis